MDIARQYKPRKGPEPPGPPTAGDVRAGSTLHVRPGSDIRAKLVEAGIDGDWVEWGDPLCEGPLRRWRTDLARRQDRAGHLAVRYFLSYGEVLRNLGVQDSFLADASRYRETVLWFEHDLFDQLILVFLLGRLRDVVAAGRVSMVTLDRHPSTPRFIGLGQLEPAHLAELYPIRSAVPPAAVRTAAVVWRALTAPDPMALARLATRRHAALPFLGAALGRYLAEFPSTTNGLSRTEQLALEALAGGSTTPREAFRAAQRREPAPFQGDSMFYASLRGLAEGDHPLIERRGPPGPPLDKLRDDLFTDTAIGLTRAGEDVLAGRSDWFRIHGVTRSIGGVNLIGPDPAWRYDPEARTLAGAR